MRRDVHEEAGPIRGAGEPSDSPGIRRPAYLRVQDTILQLIEGADYAAGDKIPSERKLAETLGLGRMTVRQGIENLVRVGVLERDSTSGTRVALPRVPRLIDSRQSFSMSEVVARTGAAPGSRLLFFESAKASRRVAERLMLAVGAPLIALRRLRMANGVPFCVETSHLPAERVPGLAAADLVENASLYALLKARYGIETRSRRGEIGVAPVSAEDAELLELAPESSVLLYRSVISDQSGRPIEYLISVNHPRRVTFTTEQEILP